MRRFKIAPEFGAGPIWDDAWDGESEICPHPRTIGLSEQLSDDLMQWQADYEATLADYPPDSAFLTEAERADWEQRGRRLEALVRVELGEKAVVRLQLPGE